jgi:hypothetical protein
LGFHGSDVVIDSFDKAFIGASTGTGWLGEGFYFSPYEDAARSYGHVITEATIHFENPYRFPDDVNPIRFVKEHGGAERFTRWVKKQGHDGIISEAVLHQIVAFEPEQIEVLESKDMSTRRNPFLSKPPKTSYKGRTMGGVVSHPGFHTSEEMEVTMPYALAKVVDVEGLGLEEDYPVILGLDMHGLEFFSDYDADKAYDDIRYGYRAAGGLNSFDEFMEATQDFLEEGADETTGLDRVAPGASGTDLLFARASAFNDSLMYFADFVAELSEEDQEVAFKGMKHGEFPSEWLAEALRQRRYVEDVDEARLKVVYFMQPVWELIFWPWDGDSPQTEATEAFIANLQDNGFTVYTTEDVQIGELPSPELRKVWGRDEGGLQYHGTSYKNLLAAAPFMKRKLPTPPSPFGRGTDFEQEALAYVEDSMDNPEIEYSGGHVKVRSGED